MPRSADLIEYFESRFPLRDSWRPGCAYSFEGQKLPPFVFEEPPGNRIGIVSLWVANPDTVTICLVRADLQKRGDGSRMMAALCEQADRLGISMKLQAVPQDDGAGAIPEDVLVRFYKRHGFVVLGDMAHKPYMVRPAKTA